MSMPWFDYPWCLLKIFCVVWLFLLVDCAEEPQCPPPPSRIGLYLSDESAALDTFLEGSLVTYQCSKGYEKVGGSGEIFCRSKNSTHFEWTTETLRCQKKSCGSPGVLLNGKFSTPDGIEFGATAYASCNPGFSILGAAYRQCYDSGWNNRVPSCERVKCSSPPPIDNGMISSQPSKGFPEFGDIIMYTCDRNYNLVGDSQLVCNELGTYNGVTPLCKELNCPTPRIENSFRVEGGPPPYKLHTYVVYRCDEGYVMRGSSKVVCEAAGWSSDFPTCHKAPPPAPPGPTPAGTDSTRGSVAPEPTPDPKPHRNWFWTFFAVGLIIACIVLMASCFIIRSCNRMKRLHPRSRSFTGQRGEAREAPCPEHVPLGMPINEKQESESKKEVVVIPLRKSDSTDQQNKKRDSACQLWSDS